MYRIINICLLILSALFFGSVISEVAQIPMLIGIGAITLPAFIANEASALYFGVSLKTIARPITHSPGAGGGINNYILAVLRDDIQTMPARSADGVTIATPIVMKSGKYMHTIYATDKKVKPIQNKIETDDNPDITAYEVGLEFWHPGLSKAILEFQALHGSSAFIIILRECASDSMYLLGEMCNPLYMKTAELQWEPTPTGGRGTQFGIKGTQSMPYAIYTSTLTLDPADSASGSASGA